MNDLETLILAYIQRPGYKPQKSDGLARKLKLTKRDLPAFHAALASLNAAGRVHIGIRDLVRPQAAAETLIGILKRTATGAGYVIPHARAAEERGPTRDIFIEADDIRDAHTGDEVLVRLRKRRRAGGQRCGRIEQVLTRATTEFVGTYFEQEGRSYVRVDGRTFTDPVMVDDPGAKRPRVNDKVVIEMLRFPSASLPGEAVLLKVLGARDAAGVDTLSIIHEFGLPTEFSADALDDARLAVQQFDSEDLSERRDLTQDTIVTIDPIDARDFDDAISLERTSDGHWHLGVHIADVAAFVPVRSDLDREALERGNSVYLPDRVIPMLPEVLSNGLASLQQGKVRYTKSVFIEFTAEGVPVHTEFANTVIRVTRRFVYEEVLPILRDPEGRTTSLSAPLRALLERMYELAMLLRRRREKKGALELTLTEVKLTLDNENRVSGAQDVVHDESHQIIEEFMLAANIAVAEKLTDLGLPFLRRVHGDPSELRLKTLGQFAAALGYPMKRVESRFDLQELLRRVHGKPEQSAINFALLRSLKQAEYSGNPLGHYALAVENYCHFTSPIRRYPDLTVHRLLDEWLRNRDLPRPLGPTEMEKVGRHCSMTERRADDAERELVKLKLLNYLKGRLGEEMDAVITGVEPFGIFCTGIQLPIDGMVHITALDPEEFFDHEPDTYSLVGRRSGARFRLGDRVRVTVANVDVDRRQLDFRIVGAKKPGEERPSGRGARDGGSRVAGNGGPRSRGKGGKPRMDEFAGRRGRSSQTAGDASREPGRPRGKKKKASSRRKPRR